LKGCRLWAMGQLDSNVQSPTAAANVVLPHAMLRMFHPCRSMNGIGYMLLSPVVLSFPKAYICPIKHVTQLEVDPTA
jgi:hypothetical protein